MDTFKYYELHRDSGAMYLWTDDCPPPLLKLLTWNLLSDIFQKTYDTSLDWRTNRTVILKNLENEIREKGLPKCLIHQYYYL